MKKYQHLVLAVLILGTILALGIVATCRADSFADKKLLSWERVQAGPTLIYEFRGTHTALTPSHKLEPALGFTVSYSLTDKWMVGGTLARWMVSMGDAPVENYANLKLTWVAFNGEKP